MVSAGIRHVHLLVADAERAAAFYRDAFGMQEQGEHAPGKPYAYVADLDGYVIEL